MASYAPSALDLGLGAGDMLQRQQEDDEEQRRKKLMKLAQPGSMTAYAGGMSPSVMDLFGIRRG